MWEEAGEARVAPGGWVLHPVASGSRELMPLYSESFLSWRRATSYHMERWRKRVKDGIVFLLVNLGDQRLG